MSLVSEMNQMGKRIQRKAYFKGLGNALNHNTKVERLKFDNTYCQSRKSPTMTPSVMQENGQQELQRGDG